MRHFNRIFRMLSTQYTNAKNGISCVFLPISPNVGLKFYFSARDAEVARKRQHTVALAGLAPKCGKKIRHLFDDVYFYSTQIVNEIPYGVSYVEEQNCREKYREAMNLLDLDYDALRNDFHLGNVGYLNGSVVAIDFGPLDGHHICIDDVFCARYSDNYYEKYYRKAAMLLMQDMDNLRNMIY